MADLFLDTDVRLSYHFVARVCASSPYPAEELDAIFKSEVAPVLDGNLWQVAGEWAGFDDEWVVSEVQGRLARGRRATPWLAPLAMADWRSVALLVARLRLVDAAERDGRAAVWSTLLKMFLDVDPIRPGDAIASLRDSGYRASELDRILRDEMWPSYGAHVDLYRRHGSSSYPAKEQIERTWTAWRTSIEAQ